MKHKENRRRLASHREQIGFEERGSMMYRMHRLKNGKHLNDRCEGSGYHRRLGIGRPLGSILYVLYVVDERRGKPGETQEKKRKETKTITKLAEL